MVWQRKHRKLLGTAVTKIPEPESNAPEEVSLTHDSPSFSGMSVTEATEAEDPSAPIMNPSSMIPVDNITSHSPGSTDWTVSPITFVEHGFGKNILNLDTLPPKVKAALEKMSAGIGDPVGAVIQQICEFYIEEESEWSELPLIDGLKFYVDNLMVTA